MNETPTSARDWQAETFRDGAWVEIPADGLRVEFHLEGGATLFTQHGAAVREPWRVYRDGLYWAGRSLLEGPLVGEAKALKGTVRWRIVDAPVLAKVHELGAAGMIVQVENATDALVAAVEEMAARNGFTLERIEGDA